jgi:hypothetical protein
MPRIKIQDLAMLDEQPSSSMTSHCGGTGPVLDFREEVVDQVTDFRGNVTTYTYSTEGFLVEPTKDPYSPPYEIMGGFREVVDSVSDFRGNTTLYQYMPKK